jgi:hypothetical protein
MCEGPRGLIDPGMCVPCGVAVSWAQEVEEETAACAKPLEELVEGLMAHAPVVEPDDRYGGGSTGCDELAANDTPSVKVGGLTLCLFSSLCL